MKESCLPEENQKTFLRSSSTQKRLQAEFKGDPLSLLIFLVAGLPSPTPFSRGQHKRSGRFTEPHVTVRHSPKGPRPWRMGELSAHSTEPLAFSLQGCGRRKLRAMYLRGKRGDLLLTGLSHSLSLQNETCCAPNPERQLESSPICCRRHR